MKTITSFTISFLVVFLFSVLRVQTAFAHGDEARIEINPERLNPGSVLDIRGVGFEPETNVTLLLMGAQADVPFGTVLVDTEGTFLLSLTLPADLGEGTYILRGTTDDNHSVDSPQLTVWGTAEPGSADGEPREEDDGLLAPMPTLAAGAPTPQMASAIATPNVTTEPSAVPYGWVAAFTGIAFLVVTLLVLRLKR